MAAFAERFPKFARFLATDTPYFIIEIQPGVTDAKIAEMEPRLGVPLPESYKAFLRITRRLSINGGAFQTQSHPFFHEEKPFDPKRHPAWHGRMTSPGPSIGMLCFADIWIDGEGDQALFDVSQGMVNGEYPIYYYNHDVPSVRRIADSFMEFIEEVASGERL